MSKEILISQPPPAAAMPNSSASNTMGMSAMTAMPPAPPPISNYKGVMLCDRPISKDAGLHAGLYGVSDSGGQPPFLSMVHAKHQLGLVPSKESRMSLGDTKKGPTSRKTEFLAKHKKWLQQFAQAQKSGEQKKEDDAVAAAERRKKFEEYSRRMRDSIRGIKRNVSDPDAREDAVMKLLGGSMVGDGTATTELVAPAKPATPKMAPQESARQTSSARGQHKPAWAMTETQVEEMEEAELNDLLEFAEKLDYEKYIDDLEVRQAVVAVQTRINEIRLQNEEPAKLQERAEMEDAEWNRRFIEQWNQTSENGPPPDYSINLAEQSTVDKIMSMEPPSARSRPAPLTESNVNAHTPALPQLDADALMETRSHASLRSVMSNTSVKSLKQVHSTRSVRAIIEKRRKMAAMTAVDEDQVDPGPSITQPQVRSYHKDEQNMNDRVQDNSASNLPYLHRNPAV